MRRVYSRLQLPSQALNILGKHSRRPLQTSCSNLALADEYRSQLATAFFNQFPSYCRMVAEAKSIARRSILVDHCGADHIALSDFNNVEHVYTIDKETRRGVAKLSLIEFVSERDAELVASQARHADGLLPVSMKIFRYAIHANSLHPSKQGLPYPVTNVRLSSEFSHHPMIRSYSDLIESHMMSMVALKMRFITLVNVEQILCSGMFNEFELMPFGSSVIDIGSNFGDLDLVVTRKQDHDKIISDILARKKPEPESSSSPSSPPASKLAHLDKSIVSKGRDRDSRGPMRWFDQILRDYMPLTNEQGVLFVHRAKVPIIRFTPYVTSIDCDLSFNLGLGDGERDQLASTYTSVIIAQILYNICRKTNLFTAAVIYFRIYAKLTSITAKGPTVGFTNFQLLSLVIFYLQQISIDRKARTVKLGGTNRLIPPFREIMNCKELQLTDDELKSILPQVVRGFFKYYASMQFASKALNLETGQLERKLDNSPVFVQNPVDKGRNICSTIHLKGLKQFVGQCQDAKSLLGEGPTRSKECPLSLISKLLSASQSRPHSRKLDRMMFERNIEGSPMEDLPVSLDYSEFSRRFLADD